ncbi:hypothetical protein MTR_3g058910 [Medicago truncatula]|uniref:Uncharacterized protein n=1 Tax=Medicago truncatula TaxID=3880 RepID=A0A072UY84_MEDTR|nr:hypothetical protein MTR_3g058910 [Medicago truncatula]
MLKCWADVSGYKQFVGEKCWSFKVNGWGGYVLKEKFKLLKAELKEWHKKHISNLPGRISSLKACISLLDCKGEGDELNDLEAVCSHFKAHYEVTVVERPSVENLCFRTFSYNDGATLLKPFSMEEVKATVWDCDSNKAPESDEVTFGFITEFWVKLKDDIMYFVTEFHRNEKLTKGINCTFIALIPKVDSPQRSDFVKGRQILFGILIANEVVDKARKCKKSYYYSRWLWDEVLYVRFWRLFDLSDNKWTSVAEMERMFLQIVGFSLPDLVAWYTA